MRAFLTPISFPENIPVTSQCVIWISARRQRLNKTVSPLSATEYRHLLNYAVKYCSMAIKYNEGPWKDASPFLRKREHFLEPCLWPVIFASSHYSAKWHERTCKVKSRRLVGIWRSKAKVGLSTVASDLLELCGERSGEWNLPHMYLAGLTGKINEFQPGKCTFFSPNKAKTFKIWKLLNGEICWFTSSKTFWKSCQPARHFSILWEIVFSEGEGPVAENRCTAYVNWASCQVLQQFMWTLTHASNNKAL